MIVGKTFAEVYEKLLKNVLENGEEVEPRGKLTKEVIQETFCIEDPNYSLIDIPGRNFSLVHAILESLLLVTTNDTVKVAGHFNERIKNYSDDGKVLYGAYGRRISPYILSMITKLKEDKDSRQAVLTIHNVKDIVAETKDVPCTITLQFTVRNNKLNMHVYMRSNDLIWGTPYDVFVFTTLQKIVANTMNIKIGKYYHTATSLHIYEDYFEKAKEYIGNCKPVEIKNTCTFLEWQMLARSFITFVSSNRACDIADVLHLALNYKELAVLVIEEIYRGKNKKFESFIDKDVFVRELYNKLEMEFAKPFTKRWAKSGLVGEK